MITHSKLSNVKCEILPNCLKGKYGYSLGEFSNTSNVVFGAERVQCVRLESSGLGPPVGQRWFISGLPSSKK